jgi:hypothetical protein
MARTNKQDLESAYEIAALEKTRASELVKRLEDSHLIEDFREQFIVRGFLMPLYSFGSRTFQTRLSSFGKHILPDTMYGKPLSLKDGTWIKNEDTAFWWYITIGQEILGVDDKSMDFMKIEGQPAVALWRAIDVTTTKLGLSGEKGGGVLLNPDHIDTEKMIAVVGNLGRREDEEGWMENYPKPGNPGWVALFWEYQEYSSNIELEIRPTWFHILNYALYNLPINRIPVFTALYTSQRQIEGIRFLDDRLSHHARASLSDSLNQTTLLINEIVSKELLQRNMRNMVYWLWHNVGYSPFKEKLSYAKISKRENVPRQTIRSNVRRMDEKLKKLDFRLIWKLIGVGQKIGLGSDMVYQSLVKRGFAPPGEIDSFSSENEIKRKMAVFKSRFK